MVKLQRMFLKKRDAYTEIPWRKMSGLRDVLIHDYFGVDLEVVWSVVENELPKLKEQIKKIIDK